MLYGALGMPGCIQDTLLWLRYCSVSDMSNALLALIDDCLK